MDDIKPVEIKIVAPEPVDTKDSEAQEARSRELGFMDDMEYHRVADFLEVGTDERREQKTAEKLSYLYDWAKAVTKSDDRITRLEAIRGLQRSLGMSDKGLPAIKKLYQYARLDQDRRRIEGEMKLIGNVDISSKTVI